jgi:GTP-binding protein YchF
MQLGIIGLPAAGKTTIFNALTGRNQPTGALAGGGRLEVHTAVVDVPDARLDALSAFFKPSKTIYAKVTYVDIGGLAKGKREGGQSETAQEGLPGPLVAQLAQMDGFVQVVRAFEDPNVPHPSSSLDPARDLAALQTELLLNDMVVAERRLTKLDEERKRGGRDKATVDREIALIQRLAACLGQEKPLRSLALTPEEQRTLAGFGLLTLKPVLVVINLAEGQAMPNLGPIPPGVEILALQGKLEMEIAQLPPEDVATFLAEYGIQEPGLRRVIRASYDLLALQTFFTLKDDEVRAWRLRRGGTALEAAATVHTDLARGFIRAEVIAWDDLLALGGLTEARSQGKLRLEGKDYVVAEGEVVHIRFNV